MNSNKPLNTKNDYAASSLVLGILSILLFYPLILLPGVDGIIALLAIILGIRSLHGNRRGIAITGIVLGSLTLFYGLMMLVQAFIYL